MPIAHYQEEMPDEIVSGQVSRYQWQRYLCPLEQDPSLTPSGFLIQPRREQFWHTNEHLRTLDELVDEPCVIILGEPGVGKTTLMKTAAEELATRQLPNTLVVYCEFRSIFSEHDLQQKLFQSDAAIDWHNNQDTLHLFLDGLDEGLERIEVLAEALVVGLRTLPLSRLCLRISCRSSLWPGNLAKELKSLWERPNLPIYKVTPLSEPDIRNAVEQEGIDADSFLREIRAREVEPFATRPITLNMLVAIYRSSGELPRSRRELYSQGCLRLCQEWDERRRRRYQSTYPFTNAQQRLAIATRIAAVTLLSNRYAVDTTYAWENTSPQNVNIHEIIGELELIDGFEIAVDERSLEETLSTALFTPHVQDCYVWAHRTFQEYLAALYITAHNMPLAQIKNLVATPIETGIKFVPQLYEATAWLAAMRQDVKTLVLDQEPVLLLKSDAAGLVDQERRQIVDWLLKAAESQQHFQGWGEYNLYRKLCHPDLATQLEPYLDAPDKGDETREIAIDIAVQCEVRSLQDVLVNLALEPTSSTSIRVHAARAVRMLGDEAARVRLKPLLDCGQDDNLHRLKAAALEALWPSHLTVQELFEALSVDERAPGLSVYHLFLTHEVTSHLLPHDLPIALAWVARCASLQHPDHEVQELMDAIVVQSLQHLHDPTVRTALVTTLMAKLEHHQDIFGREQNFGDEAQRRQLFRLLLDECLRSHKDIMLLTFTRPRLIGAEDLDWLLNDIFPQSVREEQQAIALIARRVWHRDDPAQTELVYTAIQQHVGIKETFGPAFEPINLNSEDAKQGRERQERLKELAAQREQPRAETYTPRVQQLLEQIEAGDAHLWWVLNLDLNVDPDSGHHASEFEYDFSKLPGWASADEQIRQRLLAVARLYLHAGDPSNDEWFDTKTYYRPALAGYRALRLLAENDLSFVQGLNSEIWAKWIPAILVAPNTWNTPELHKLLLQLANSHAPDVFVERVTFLIEQEANTSDTLVRTVSLPADVWHPEFTQVLWDKLHTHPDDPDYVRRLLPLLLEHDYEEAHSFVVTVLSRTQEETAVRQCALIAAALLLSHPMREKWRAFQVVMQMDEEFAREAFLSAARSWEYDSELRHELTVFQTESLYGWLEEHFPRAEDPEHLPGVAYSVTPRDQIAQYRERLLNSLRNAASVEAVDAIARIVERFPHRREEIARVLHEARTKLIQESWLPIEPSALLALAQNHKLRLVKNNDQLLEVLLESLGRLQRKLTLHETPAAIDLWNEGFVSGDGYNYYPKDENRLSDYIKRHLEADLQERLVIANREVEIRRGLPGAPGQRTDIYVVAPVQDPHLRNVDIARVVIEVKANWHPDLLMAMQTQLVENYMAQNNYSHGLYLVGWFNCEAWDRDDGGRQDGGRRARAFRHNSLEQLQDHLRQQTANLSGTGRSVRYHVLNTSLEILPTDSAALL